MADTLERLGDPAAARLHRLTAERLLQRPAEEYGEEHEDEYEELRGEGDEDVAAGESDGRSRAGGEGESPSPPRPDHQRGAEADLGGAVTDGARERGGGV